MVKGGKMQNVECPTPNVQRQSLKSLGYWTFDIGRSTFSISTVDSGRPFNSYQSSLSFFFSATTNSSLSVNALSRSCSVLGLHQSAEITVPLLRVA
jgi:hypothetical protein